MSGLTASFVSTLSPNPSNTFVVGTTQGWVVKLSYSSSSGEALVSNVTLWPAANLDTQSSPSGIQTLNYTCGTDNFTFVSVDNGISTYLLTISNVEVLPDTPYYASISCTLSDGSTISTSSPVTLPVVPAAVSITSTNALINRTNGYGTTNTINILFTQVQNYSTNAPQIKYKVVLQYMSDPTSGYSYLTSEPLTYNSNINNSGSGGISWTINNVAIDEGYVAVSALATYSINNASVVVYGAVSNTVPLTDQNTPQPPQNLSLVYNYVSQSAVLTWNANPTDGLTDVSTYNIYRKIGSGTYTYLSNVAFVSTSTVYTHTDNIPIGTPDGTVISYIIKSTNTNGLSSASNEANLTTVTSSSAPQTLIAYAIASSPDISPQTQDVVLTFSNPSSISGSTTGAYFNINIYSSDPTGSNTPTPIYSTTQSYSSTAVTYTVSMDNITYVTNVTQYWASCNLITSNPNTNPSSQLIGMQAYATFSSAHKPYFAEYNTITPLTWTPLTSPNNFTVYINTGSLMRLAITYKVVNGEIKTLSYSTIGVSIVTNTLTMPQPTQIVSPYSFAGEFQYNFENIQQQIGSTSVILSMDAVASSGAASFPTLTGSAFPPNQVGGGYTST